MFRKKAGLVCIVAAMGIVCYGQTSKPRARSANLQGSSGYLGVGLRDVTPEIAKALGIREVAGVIVTWVVRGEAGERAGVHEQDVILELNGKKVNSDSEFTEAIFGKAPGTKINLVILRGNTKQNLTATLGTRPLGLPLQVTAVPPGAERLSPEDLEMAIAAANAVPAPRIGFYVVEMLPQLAAFFGVHQGLLVESVTPGTPAEKAGLKAGDVVTKVNGIPVTTEREIMGIVRQAGKNISFTVVRNKKAMTLSVELAWNRDPSDRTEIN